MRTLSYDRYRVLIQMLYYFMAVTPEIWFVTMEFCINKDFISTTLNPVISNISDSFFQDTTFVFFKIQVFWKNRKRLHVIFVTLVQFLRRKICYGSFSRLKYTSTWYILLCRTDSFMHLLHREKEGMETITDICICGHRRSYHHMADLVISVI